MSGFQMFRTSENRTDGYNSDVQNPDDLKSGCFFVRFAKPDVRFSDIYCILMFQVLEVFDENRLTRDDFLGMVELPLNNLPKESDDRQVPHKFYILRPRSARSKVKGHLQVKLRFLTFNY